MTDPLRVIGWFDAPDQQVPVHDPPHNGPCMVCGEPLAMPLKTVSLMYSENGPRKSYFYRAHSPCIDTPEKGFAADEKAFHTVDILMGA